MNEFKEQIIKAIYSIKKEYFVQKIINRNLNKKYYERVFCYEMYHQLRILQDSFKDLSISGEVVKTVYDSWVAKKRIPDILIHNFGTHANNEVVIEVKTDKVFNETTMYKDFTTLDIFTDSTRFRFDYKIGVYLIINQDFKTNIQNLHSRNLRKLNKLITNNSRIEVWNIDTPKFNNDNSLKEGGLKIYTNDDLRELFRLNNNVNA